MNTGWTGGPYGIGNRMSIKDTRACIDSILDGSIRDSTFSKDPTFSFDVPDFLNGVDSGILNPRNSWKDKAAYDEAMKNLAQMYTENFEKYTGKGSADYSKYGPAK